MTDNFGAFGQCLSVRIVAQLMRLQGCSVTGVFDHPRIAVNYAKHKVPIRPKCILKINAAPNEYLVRPCF